MLNLILYNFNRVSIKLKYIITYTLLGILILIKCSEDIGIIPHANMWDYYNLLLYRNILVINIPVVFSILLNTYIFYDYNLHYLVDIRICSKIKWFTSKSITIIISNFIIIVVFSIFILIIGTVKSSFDINWNSLFLNEVKSIPIANTLFKHMIFYSPIKISIINILVYTFFVSFLMILFLIISLIYKKSYIAIILAVSYILCSKTLQYMGNIKTFKFLVSDNYLQFSNRNYYNLDIQAHMFMTVRQTLTYSLIELIIVFILGIVMINFTNLIYRDKVLKK